MTGWWAGGPEDRIQPSRKFTSHLVFPRLSEQPLSRKVPLHVLNGVMPLFIDGSLRSALLLMAGLCLVIVGIRLALDQRWSATPPCPLERLVRHPINGDHVVTIDGNARKTMALCPAAQVFGVRSPF